MDVELYIYDLSQGLARQYSASFLGTQIDAVYHTSLVFDGVEYFFGAGVQTSLPGATQHGLPIEILPLGKTDVPMKTILIYLNTLRTVYTRESYDLFFHNCNNFTQDFAIFLVGAGLPDRITSLPRTVLDTPFGQLVKRQIQTSIRGFTQAPHADPLLHSMSFASRRAGVIDNVTELQELKVLLARARRSRAVIFFTSATCSPCKAIHPIYDELATEYIGKATFITVDISRAYEIASKYEVKETPTFMTFLEGEMENEWSGADESQIRENVRMLLEMVEYISHPHTALSLPTLERSHIKPITYAAVPNLEKLVRKLGPLGTNRIIVDLQAFINKRQISGAAGAQVPNLPALSAFLGDVVQRLEPVSLFPIIDLFRLAIVDPRVSGYFAKQPSQSAIFACLERVVSLRDECPYPLRLVSLHLACNLFSSPLFPPHLLGDTAFSGLLIQLTTFSLLDSSHESIVGAAIILAYNISAFIHTQRQHQKDDILPEFGQVELMAALLEVTKKPQGQEGLRGLLLSIGLLGYLAPQDGELIHLCKALDTKEIMNGVKGKFEELDGLLLEVEAVIFA